MSLFGSALNRTVITQICTGTPNRLSDQASLLNVSRLYHAADSLNQLSDPASSRCLRDSTEIDSESRWKPYNHQLQREKDPKVHPVSPQR